MTSTERELLTTMVTVVDRVVLPPVPVQIRVKVLSLVSAPMVSDPEVPLLPDQAPDAEQLLALEDDQLTVVEPPDCTEVGLALNVTVGAAATVTVRLLLLLPPGPEQLSVKVLVLLMGPTDWLPDVPLLPDHALEALQLVALVVDQVKVALLPAANVVGLADKVIVGAGGACTVSDTVRFTLPPIPVQVSV